VSAPHDRPHDPQLFASLARVTHAPPQYVWPDAEHVHTPLLQNEPAPHATPQAPQLLASVSNERQLPAQKPCPAGQAHVPETQL
jgi:hypothetical protein